MSSIRRLLLTLTVCSGLSTVCVGQSRAVVDSEDVEPAVSTGQANVQSSDAPPRSQAERRTLRIVTLGDSITKGVRSGVTTEQTFAFLLEKGLQSNDLAVGVTNVGIGGERTDQALKRLEQVIALHPDVVTVMYGTNDSYIDPGKTKSRITVAEYRDNLTRIVHELLSRGIQPVLMTEPRWSDKARPNGVGENPNVRLEPFVSACREVAQEARVPLVDHYSRWSQVREQGQDLHELTTDGCHPNPAGHRELVETMLPVVQDTIGPSLKFREKLLQQQPVRVVCFGDSVTGVYYHTGSRRAYTDMLEIALNRISEGDNVATINAGISGNTTVNALARIDRDVLAHKPDLVTVMFGLNDMVRVPLEQYTANLRTIVEKCHSAGAEVVLATPNNVVTTSGRPSEKLVEYCDAVRRVARELNVPLCDCYQQLAAYRELQPTAWRLLLSDPIHPNMDGHRRIAEQLARTITGIRVSLSDTQPLQPGLAHTLAKLEAGQPIKVLAMPPADEFIAAALKLQFPDAQVEITKWSVAGKSVAEIEADAKSRVRPMKPDLVVIAVPRSAAAESDETFAGSYAWVMNWSLNFGSPTWDCVVLHPAAWEQSTQAGRFDELVRQLVHAQDLHLIDRRAGDESSFEAILLSRIAELMSDTDE